MSQIQALPAPKPRISAKLRKSIELRIRKGMKISDACEEAGLSCAGYYKAMSALGSHDEPPRVPPHLLVCPTLGVSDHEP